jgi:hypothetical protein
MNVHPTIERCERRLLATRGLWRGFRLAFHAYVWPHSGPYHAYAASRWKSHGHIFFLQLGTRSKSFSEATLSEGLFG